MPEGSTGDRVGATVIGMYTMPGVGVATGPTTGLPIKSSNSLKKNRRMISSSPLLFLLAGFLVVTTFTTFLPPFFPPFFDPFPLRPKSLFAVNSAAMQGLRVGVGCCVGAVVGTCVTVGIVTVGVGEGTLVGQLPRQVNVGTTLVGTASVGVISVVTVNSGVAEAEAEEVGDMPQTMDW